MKPQNPGTTSMFTQTLNSMYKVFSGNISFGTPTAWDASGNPTSFNQDNMDGVLIRVGPLTNPNSLPNFWAGNNTATVITHNLNRRPVGYKIANKSKACDVYSGSPMVATLTTITLYVTDDTADTTLYIF